MSHILVTIKYHIAGYPPVMTTTAVPIQSHLTFNDIRRRIIDEYKGNRNFEVSVILI